MDKSRLEALSDGVLAIIITIMVLNIEVPDGSTWSALAQIFPSLLSYVLSFVYIGIYWNSHHHMMKLAGPISGGILWANLHLLFWLSLVPLMTRWIDQSGFATVPVFIYGVDLLMSAIAYTILAQALVRAQGKDGPLAKATRNAFKSRLSPLLYIAGCLLTFISPVLGLLSYAIVAAVWIVPDRRIERAVKNQH